MKILLVHTPFDWKRPLTLLAWAIRKATGSYWNHAAILVELHGDKFILESDIKGVRLVPYSAWVKKQIVEVWHVWHPDYKKALSRVGYTGYGFMDLLWFMPIYLITKRFYGRKADESDNRPTCYEYVAWVLGFHNWFKMTPDKFRAVIPLIAKRQMEASAKTLTNINLITMEQDYKIWYQPQNEEALHQECPFLDLQNGEYVSPTVEWPNGYSWIEQGLTPEQFAIVDAAANNFLAIDIKPKPYPPGHPLGR